MRFSIITPLYNKAPYIAKAVNSVLAQTFSDYELIIMDDGSQDESFVIASKAIEGKDNCYIHRQQNAGVSLARNNAVSMSHGDYLCFLDADDWWEPNYLEEMSRLIEEYPTAGIYGTNYIIVNERKHKTRVADIGVDPAFEKGYINYCQAYAGRMYMPLWTGAVCIPRAIFDEMQGFPIGVKLGEDFLLWLRIAVKYKVVFLNKPLAYYNQDVEEINRGVVSKGYNPDTFMIFHLNQYEEREKNDSDLKILLDRLRVYSLLRFRLNGLYTERVNKEIAKVNFSNVDKFYRPLYRLPFPLNKAFYFVHLLASRIKHNEL